MLSFVLAGFACAFAALCYAEFASMVPVAGSAYTYAYATLGELFAWIIGWDLLLEYGVGAASVAHGWSHYFADFLAIMNIHLPHAYTDAPFDFNPATGKFVSTGAIIDLPALLIPVLLIVCTAVLIMRRRHPEVERPFRCPLVPLVPLLGIASCLVLMFSLPAENWHRLILWLLLGFAVYFGYGRYHSVLARMRHREIRASSRSP